VLCIIVGRPLQERTTTRRLGPSVTLYLLRVTSVSRPNLEQSSKLRESFRAASREIWEPSLGYWKSDDGSVMLSSATNRTFPASGETPKLQAGLWAPNLTDPRR
jgi:hypothetical protein